MQYKPERRRGDSGSVLFSIVFLLMVLGLEDQEGREAGSIGGGDAAGAGSI